TQGVATQPGLATQRGEAGQPRDLAPWRDTAPPNTMPPDGPHTGRATVPQPGFAEERTAERGELR
ncbi:MAG: hypothetical protein ACRDT6_24930, partial [Micromonosporaceae bacterium]